MILLVAVALTLTGGGRHRVGTKVGRVDLKPLPGGQGWGVGGVMSDRSDRRVPPG